MKKILVLILISKFMVGMDAPLWMGELTDIAHSQSPVTALTEQQSRKASHTKDAARIALKLPYYQFYTDLREEISTESDTDGYDEWYIPSDEENDLAKRKLLKRKATNYYLQRDTKNNHLREIQNHEKDPEISKRLKNLTIRQTIHLIDQLESFPQIPLGKAIDEICKQSGYLTKEKIF